MAREFDALYQLARVLLQVPGAERAPEVMGLHVGLLQAALPDPSVQAPPQGALGYTKALLGDEEVGEGASASAGTKTSLVLR